MINKDRNRLNKDTFEYIITLKSWGLFKERIEKENEENEGIIEENYFEISN
jgi:hypothetical protein